MTLRYRAIWADDRADLVDHAWATFGTWVAGRIPGIELPYEGTVATASGGGPEVSVRRAAVDGHVAVVLDLSETTARGERRVISLVAIDEREGPGWLWVDVDRSAVGRERATPDPAPRFVLDLIGSGVDPRVDGIWLETKAVAMKGRTVAALVRKADRTLPLVVFTHDPAFDASVTLARAMVAHDVLAGSAEVFVLSQEEGDAFQDALDPWLGVGGGAARVYVPGREVDGVRRERDLRVEPARMGMERSVAARILAGLLLPVVTARRPPPVWDEVRRALHDGDSGPGTSDLALLRRAEAEIERLRSERDDLRLQIELLAEDHFDTQADLLATEEELTRVQAGFEHLWVAQLAGSSRLLERAGPERAQDPQSAFELVDLPVPTSIRAAVDQARQHLHAVVVHPDAPRDLEDLEAHPNAPAWASSVWRGLRALDAYARSGYDGNFRSWCTNSGDPWAWSANDKKLALHESETVQDNERLRRQRLLPVDPRVDPSGRILMWPHLKIAEGGGPAAPRVYFYDDTRGSTHQVHVGFIGPHRHLENTRTN